jgi:uncharacterized delta-60 repeat protein
MADFAYALAMQPDGKPVAAGTAWNGSDYDFALARYNPDGSLDAGFGSDGKVTTNFFGIDDVTYALVVQPDGKLVAAGSTGTDFALARYNPDGSLDTSFDGDGRLTTDFLSRSDYAYALALQPDGKTVVAGYAHNGSNNDFALARYNLDGSLDASFDSDGKLITDFFGDYDVAYALVAQPDGKIVAAGVTDNSGDLDFALARYNPDGSLDANFNGNGLLSTDFGSNDEANALVLQPDGKLVAAGDTGASSIYDFALARFNPDGSLDVCFDGDGMLTTDFGVFDDASALVLQPDGKLVAAGFTGAMDSINDFALSRYAGDGGSFVYDPNSQFEWLAAGEVTTEHTSPTLFLMAH